MAMSDLVLSMNDLNPTTKRDREREAGKPRPRSFARGLLLAIPLAALLWALLIWLF